MKAEIKYIHSPDILDLKSYLPDKLNEFSFLLQIMIGEKGKEGAENFNIIVCSPNSFKSMFKDSDMFFGKSYLFMKSYNYQKMWDFLCKYVDSINGETWDDIVFEMSKIAFWEFDNYKM